MASWGVEGGVAMTEVMRIKKHKEDNTISAEKRQRFKISSVSPHNKDQGRLVAAPRMALATFRH